MAAALRRYALESQNEVAYRWNQEKTALATMRYHEAEQLLSRGSGISNLAANGSSIETTSARKGKGVAELPAQERRSGSTSFISA